MKSNTSTNKKPYPKAYIFTTLGFAALFVGIWLFYGMLYRKDMQVINHCKINVLANSITEYAAVETPDNMEKIKKAENEINSIANDIELSTAESNNLKKLSENITALNGKIETSKELKSFDYSEVAFSAKNLAESSQDNAESVISTSKQSHVMGDYIMMTIFVLVTGSILANGQFARKKDQALAVKEEENTQLESDVKNVRHKAYELAFKNLTTNCGNRYALIENISKAIDNGTSFCIAKFNMCDYSNVLSTFGYSRMDDCLSRVAASIKRHYGDLGTLYIMDDESVAFVFSHKITSREASEKAEQIRHYINDKLGRELHVNVPITGAVLCTHHFKGKDSDEILTNLHSVSIQSIATAPLPVV